MELVSFKPQSNFAEETQKAMPDRQAGGRQGFAPLIIIIIATIVIGAGVGGFLVLREKKMPASEKTVQPQIPLQKVGEEIPLPETHDIGDVTAPKSAEKTEGMRQKEISITKDEPSPIKSTPSFGLPPPASPVQSNPEVSQETKPELPRIQPEPKIKSIPTPGYTELIAVSDGVAASLSRDDVIQIVDVEDPFSPVKIQTVDTPAFAEAAYHKDGYLYIADSRELRILDNAGKTAGVYNLQNFWPAAISVNNEYVYLASGSEMLILKVQGPDRIQWISKIQLTGRAPSHIAVKDGYAYVVETLGGLNIIDVRNPNSPKIVKVFPFESHTAGFGVVGKYAYIGRVASTKSTAQGYSQTSVFEVIDISDPASAVVTASLTIPTDIRGLDVAGSYAYIIGSFPYRLTPIDVSTPSNPKIINTGESIIGPADLQDIVVENNFAFLADGSTGLRIVDISDITNPRHIKDLDLQGRAFNLYKWGNTLYVNVEQKYFNLADVRIPENSRLTYSELFTASFKYTSLILRDKKAYFNGGGARIYDIADIQSPQKIPIKPAEVDSIQIQGNYLYSTIGEIGLLIYDLSDPASLTQVSRTPFPMGIPRDLSVDGRWAVGISNSPYSINVFDISDPRKPVARDSYVYQKYPGSVTVKDNHAYVARGEDGVDIFTIYPGGSLELIKNIIIPQGSVSHVTVIGSTAFIVRDGADMYDITNPVKPIFLQHVSNRGEANRIAVYNGYLYIADGYAGITIVKM
ncbi:MAG: hypothetical protein AAB604_02955 [Patescibacteria group bacterium]